MFILGHKNLDEMGKEVKSLCEKVDNLSGILSKKEEVTSVSLMRRILGSIDVSDEPNEEVFNNRAGAIFKDVIEPKLKRMAREQERFTAAEAANWDQAMFGRGTLNGIELVREEFEKAYSVYSESTKPPEPPTQPFNPIPET
jgi:hypothetical protein